MLGAAFNEAYSAAALLNAALLLLLSVLPALWLGFLWQTARPPAADFSLRTMEAIELERAETIPQKIAALLAEIELLARSGTGAFWRRMRYRAQVRHDHRTEIEDLRACANHLRAYMAEIRRRPIRRLRGWCQAISRRFAYSAGLVAYLAIAALVTSIYILDQPVRADEVIDQIHTRLLWSPVDERLLYANGAVSTVVLALVPIFYVMRRQRLFSDHRIQARILREFAALNPDELVESDGSYGFMEEPLPADTSWFAVLELPPTATLAQIRDAYRKKVKQTHPDRVNGMAPAFKELAEAETKKLNAAYQQALLTSRVG
jgi:DnaJ domain